MTRKPVVTLAVVVAVALLVVRASADEKSRKEAIKHYKEGQKALSSEHWKEAEEEFRLATQLDPLLVAAHYGLGQTYMATKRYADAVEAYSAGETAFQDQQAQAATNRLEFEKRLDDQIKALQDDINTAQRQVSGAGAQSTQMAIDRNESQINTLRQLRHRGGSEPQPTPHWLSLALGSAYFRNGNMKKAEEAYQAALKVKPDLGEAHVNLAVVYMITKRLDEAESEVALAEKNGVKVPQGLKDEIAKRKKASES